MFRIYSSLYCNFKCIIHKRVLNRYISHHFSCDTLPLFFGHMSTAKGKMVNSPLEVEALLASVVANEEDREDEEDDAIG